METCDIYIKSIQYEQHGWSDNPDFVLEQINNNLNEIPNFYFYGLSLNMSQVYNTSIKSSNYEAMMMVIKNIKYKQDHFLTLISTEELIKKIKEQLSFVENLSFGAIEVRNSKLYTDIELGLV